MKLIFSTCLFYLITSLSISAQTCYPSGITFTSQAEVDQFPSLNPGCNIIGDNLTIQGSDINSLDSLYSINVIEGNLTLNFSSLTNFKGLNNLDTIRNTLFISQSNTNLSSFEGLESLKKLGSNNEYHRMQQIPILDFTGLDSLNSISGILEIKNCNDLISLAGLELITELDNLFIEDCYSFSSLQGFGNVAELSSLKLEKLQFLENLDGLEGLSTIHNSVSIKNNNLLNDISALDDVDLTSLYSLNIWFNPNLSTCDLNSICEYIDIDGDISIFDNNIGCNWLSEIVVACCANDTIWCPEEMESCYPDGLSLTSQLEVDLFPVVNPGCKIIGGNLSINGSDITHLDSLYSIEVIQGGFFLTNNSLINFEGLNNLDTIGEQFNIGNENPNLVSFEGLESLKKIGSIIYDFHRIRSESIVDFTGLDSLQTVQGILDIKNCSNLTSLNGLGNITEIDELSINNCPSFSSLQGFGNNADLSILRLSYLPSIGNFNGIESVQNISQITLSNMSSLTSMDSLSHLTSIDQLFLLNCDVLKTLDGLEGLLDIQVFARFLYNDELSDITALENVDLSDINSLRMYNNPKLSSCAINSICDFIDIGGITELQNNDIGCNNVLEIEYDCDGLLSIFEDNGSGFSNSTNNYWHNLENWKNNEIPNENSYVIIPIDLDCLIQSDSIANCKILEIRKDAQITCESNGQLNVLEE